MLDGTDVIENNYSFKSLVAMECLNIRTPRLRPYYLRAMRLGSENASRDEFDPHLLPSVGRSCQDFIWSTLSSLFAYTHTRRMSQRPTSNGAAPSGNPGTSSIGIPRPQGNEYICAGEFWEDCAMHGADDMWAPRVRRDDTTVGSSLSGRTLSIPWTYPTRGRAPGFARELPIAVNGALFAGQTSESIQASRSDSDPSLRYPCKLHGHRLRRSERGTTTRTHPMQRVRSSSPVQAEDKEDGEWRWYSWSKT